MNKEQKPFTFVGKDVEVRLFKNNFTLYGVVVDETPYGIYLKTEQATSFLNWETIQYVK